MKKYDLIVIGSGGGTRIASPAVGMGYKVALIEKGALGGTCLNRGCIPSKMLIYPAHVASLIRDAERFDMKTAKQFPINFEKIVKRISKTVDADSQRIEQSYKTNKAVDFYQGHARFLSDKVIEVAGKKITAQYIVVATGARPRIPNIPGLAGTPYMTSTEALRNTKLPKKLIVIGGGYIACELGYAYAALGADVEFIVRGGLLSAEDEDIQKEFTRVFAKKYNVRLNAKPIEVKYKNKSYEVVYEQNGKKHTAKGDALLVAVGVAPNTDDLGLENTGIKLSDQGFVSVDKYLQTTVPGVFAMGDILGRFLFRHAVNFEADYLLQNIFKKKRSPIQYPPMPHAVFTDPEIAGVEKTEKELRELGINYVVGITPYQKSAMGMARLLDHGIVKLLFERKSRRLVGAHVIGDEAATMIHQLIMAMSLQATVDDLTQMIYVHPALPEVVRNAARNALAAFED